MFFLKRLNFYFVIVFMCVGCHPLKNYEKSVLFYPSVQMQATPAKIGLKYEDVNFLTADSVKLNAWFVKHPAAQATLLFFHGNAGNISYRLNKIELFYNMRVNIFIVDYRGYGKSAGKPSEQGLYQDGMAAFKYLHKREDVDMNKIVLYGESLGGAIAVDLATRYKVRGIIIDSSFTSIGDLAQEKFPLVPRFLIYHEMNSLEKIKNIDVPKLFIHSPQDEIIPFSMGKRLFEVAPSPKVFLKITGGHNDGYYISQQKYQQGIESFLSSLP